MALDWNMAEQIGIALYEKFPELDPLSVRFTDLHKLVIELEDFDDDPKGRTNRSSKRSKWLGTRSLRRTVSSSHILGEGSGVPFAGNRSARSRPHSSIGANCARLRGPYRLADNENHRRNAEADSERCGSLSLLRSEIKPCILRTTTAPPP